MTELEEKNSNKRNRTKHENKKRMRMKLQETNKIYWSFQKKFKRVGIKFER
jgi:hypothetical protein